MSKDKSKVNYGFVNIGVKEKVKERFDRLKNGSSSDFLETLLDTVNEKPYAIVKNGMVIERLSQSEFNNKLK